MITLSRALAANRVTGVRGHYAHAPLPAGRIIRCWYADHPRTEYVYFAAGKYLYRADRADFCEAAGLQR